MLTIIPRASTLRTAAKLNLIRFINCYRSAHHHSYSNSFEMKTTLQLEFYREINSAIQIQIKKIAWKLTIYLQHIL